jgi:hypothetical protein
VSDLGNAVKYLWAIGVAGQLIASLLFVRMAVQVNRVLAPEKRIPLIESRLRFFELKRLHEDLFPASTIRTVWFVLLAVSTSLLAIGVMLAVKPK